MKKIFLLIAFQALAFTYTCFAQDAAPSNLLTSYYSIKDALVAGNAELAATKADEFTKAAKSIDEKTISADKINTLVKAATAISQNKDLKQQRLHFADLSTDMISTVKAYKIWGQPVYEVYCPMKKAYWLSSEKAIKNPYYGSAMLTCGKVVETIN